MSMREQMARAMFATSNTSAIGHSWESISEQHRLDYLEEVDAALDALTANPGEDVLAAAYGEETSDAFTAMIRAIKEGK